MNENDGRVIGGERRDQYHDFYDVCLFEKNIDIDGIDIGNSEVAAVKWVNNEQFEKMLDDGEIIQTLRYFKSLYKKIIEKRNKQIEKEER